MTIFELCQWLEGTRLAVLIQESPYGFPIVVAVHILGLTLSVDDRPALRPLLRPLGLLALVALAIERVLDRLAFALMRLAQRLLGFGSHSLGFC